MTNQETLSKRRAMLGRLTLGIVDKRGPLTQEDRQTLNQLRTEMDELEGDLLTDAQRKREAAFRSYLRHGLDFQQQGEYIQRGITNEERAIIETRDMGTGGQGAYPGATSGFFAPIGFSGQVESAMKYSSGMVDNCTIVETASGTPMGWPTDNDTATVGELVPENVQVTSVDIPISQTILKTYKYSSKLVKLSVELVQDSGIMIDSDSAEKFGIRIGRALNKDLTTGTGTGQPTGLLTTASVGATAAGTSTNDGTGASTNTIGTDDLVNLETSVDPAYRKRAKYMMHANTLGALRKVKDKSGRPVFPDLHGGGVDRIHNYEIAWNDDFPQLQSGPSSPPATVASVGFGDFKKYVIRRTPLIVMRLPLRFQDYGMVAYLGFWRNDGVLLDGGGGAVKVLTNTY